VKHLHAVGLQADLREDVPDTFNPPFGVGITFQVMAVSGQSARYHHPICTCFQSLQNHQRIQLTGTGELDDLDGGWVLHAQPSRQVRRGVGAVLTAISDNL
jgi:hypothetical protein